MVKPIANPIKALLQAIRASLTKGTALIITDNNFGFCGYKLLFAD
jgi:hypothetical protein